VGRSLRDLNLRKNFNVNVLAAGPDNHLTVNPPASHVLAEGELLVVMGSSEALAGLPGS
jgi:trk system potassium uptake protein TrkA